MSVCLSENNGGLGVGSSPHSAIELLSDSRQTSGLRGHCFLSCKITMLLWVPDRNPLQRHNLMRQIAPSIKSDFFWTTEDEMVGWHHRLNGHEFDLALGDGEGLGSLVCCGSIGSQGVRHG